MEPEYRKVRVSDVVVDVVIRDSIDKARVKDLAGSMERDGLAQPIVVRAEGGKLVLVAGHHRLLAAKDLGWKEIDAHVMPVDATHARVVQLVENLKRTDLNPIERAKAMKAYVDVRRRNPLGAPPTHDPSVAPPTYDVLAKELGISQPELSNTLRLLEQPPGVQDVLSRGLITPGHVEHVLAPLVGKIPSAAIDKFAGEIAHQKLDIRTAKQEAGLVVQRVERARAQQEANKLVQKAKVRKCPTCMKNEWTKNRAGPEAAYTVDGRTIFACENGVSQPYSTGGHMWDGETGELYYTPAQQKEKTRREAEERKWRNERTRGSTKKAAVTRNVERAYATIFSRATGEQWAQALLDAAKKAGIKGLEAGYDLSVEPDGRKRSLGDASIRFDVLDVPDGNGGTYRTRLTIGSYTSKAVGTDNVAEAGDVAKLRKQVREILEFQRKAVKVRQDDKDLWPVAVDGFKLGEKVRLGAKAHLSSYVGKQGTILAFDYTTNIDTNYAGGRTRSWAAVLDIGASHKLHWVEALEKLDGKAAAKPRK